MTKRRKLQLAAATSGIALILTTLLAIMAAAYVPGEIILIRLIYTMGEWLWFPMIVITQLGSPWIIFGLALGLMYVHRYRLALRLMVAGGVTYLVVMFLKLVVMRPRPFLAVSDVLSRELSISGNGFPSGHSAIIAFVCWSLWFLLHQKYRPVLIAIAIAVGISRVYLGVHSPLDVAGGLALGVLVASLQQLVPSVFKGIRTR